MSGPQTTAPRSAPISSFADPAAGQAFLEDWNEQIQRLNGMHYQRLALATDYGQTVIWHHRPSGHIRDRVVIFPGARTCALFWDFDHGLAPLKQDYELFLVEVNGQPSLSDGHCPDSNVETHSAWANQVLELLGLESATLMGASLGGQIGLSLCATNPQRVKRLILINPAGIRAFSLKWRNLYHNFMPILRPSEKSLKAFFDQVVFHPPGHDISPPYRALAESYMLYVLRNFKFAGKYPSEIGKAALNRVKTPLELILGDQDILFPYDGPKGTVAIAQAEIPGLRGIHLLPGIGHGIETSPAAFAKIKELLEASL